MRRKMEEVARELQGEWEELFAFVKQRFIEILKGLGKPEPKFPEFDMNIVLFLKQKAYVKTVLGVGEIPYGSPIERRPKNAFYSDFGAMLLTRNDAKNKKKKIFHILLNCPYIRRETVKERIELKKLMTLVLMHEMIHALEGMTCVYILRSSFTTTDGFTIPIYEAWKGRKK